MKPMKPMACAAALAVGALLAPLAMAQDDAPKPSYTHITNVNIFDGVNEKTTKGSVLIEDNLIKEVGASIKAPEGATVIDGGGTNRGVSLGEGSFFSGFSVTNASATNASETVGGGIWADHAVTISNCSSD